MKLLSALALIAASAGLASCVTNNPNSAFSTVRVQEMGTGQYMVSCVDGPGHCATQANKSCPAGFDVVSNVANPGDYGRMTMIIKCHAPAA